jgi:N4-gp56 family major capsid protein
MANTVAATGLTPQQWDSDFFEEWLFESRFRPYMGTGEGSMIQIKEDLTKKRGDSITFALVNKLDGAGVTGTGTLEGNEEAMDSRSYRLYVDKIRNGVRIPEMEEQRSAIDLRDAGRSVLKTWISELTKNNIISALGSINGIAYGTASEGQKDAWLVDNADRVLFGAAKANNAANDHSAALLTVDSTTDRLTPAAISLMKRIAKTASPKIRPITVKGDEQWYVMFANSLAFRDLANNTTMTQANRDALARGMDNPLFTGGDLIWDGVIVKEIEDIASVAGVGASSIDVAPVYLCGAQNLAIGWAKRTTSKTQVFDYGDKYGIAIEEIRGISKLIFGSGASDTADLKDHGQVTGWFAAIADS